MSIKIIRNIALIPLMTIGIQLSLYSQMTPQQAILKMTCGMNVGRSLELANEGDANSRYIQEYYFEDFKTAGFNFVRIPIQWDKHTGTTAPYTIDSIWLKRVEQVVNWSLKHGLITIINSHHDSWILEDNNYTAADLARFDSIWSQISFRFKNKSDSLLFEIANEPNIGISLVDKINASVIPLIRKNNPTRIIIFGGSGTQLSTLKNTKIPNDSNLIASFHTYEPWAFAGEGTGTWGTTSQIKIVKSLMKDAAAWSTAHKIPLLLGEFGAVGKCEANSRMKWFYTHIEEARRYNIAPAVWHDFGNFGIYTNTVNPTGKWNTAIKEIIVYTHPLSADSLSILVDKDSYAKLLWKNRAADYKWIRIEKKEGSGAYKSLDTLAGSDTTFIDSTTVLGKTYTYRIISELSTGIVTYSYPASKKIELVTSTFHFNAENSENFTAYVEDNHLNIKTNFDKFNQRSQFNLFTLSGQLIRKANFQSNVVQVNVSSLSKGMYLLNVTTNEGLNQTMKFVKM